jgi:hypothetical protein
MKPVKSCLSSCWSNMGPFLYIPCDVVLGKPQLLSLTADLELTFHAAIYHNPLSSLHYDSLYCFGYNSRELGVNPFFCFHVVQLITHIWILVSITQICLIIPWVLWYVRGKKIHFFHVSNAHVSLWCNAFNYIYLFLSVILHMKPDHTTFFFCLPLSFMVLADFKLSRVKQFYQFVRQQINQDWQVQKKVWKCSMRFVLCTTESWKSSPQSFSCCLLV